MPVPALLLCALLATPRAAADQLAFHVDRAPSGWDFDVRWEDHQGGVPQAVYTLPAGLVRQDLAEPLRLDLGEVAAVVAAEVRASARALPGVQATVTVGEQGRIDLRAQARSRADVDRALARMAEVRDAAWQAELDRRGYTRIRDGISPDHARHAATYAADLAPVVAALGGPGPSARDFADRALAFVQAIPYEQRARISDLYRRPLSVLGRNKGDCDSKTTLFLALVHQAWPEVGLAIAYVEGHAFALVELDKERGDLRLKAEGRRFIAAEPVGPAAHPLGEVDPKTARLYKSGWREVRLVPGT